MSSSNNEVNARAKARHDYRSRSYQARKGSLVDIKNEYLDEIFDDILADNSIPEQILEQEQKIIRNMIFGDDENEGKQKEVFFKSNKSNKTEKLGEITITVDVFDEAFFKYKDKLMQKICSKYLDTWSKERGINLYSNAFFGSGPLFGAGTKISLNWSIWNKVSST